MSNEEISLSPPVAGVLNNRRRYDETKEDVIERLLLETYEPVELQEYLRTFRDYGADFIAVPEESLAKGCLQVIANLPSETAEEVDEYVASAHGVTIEGEDFLPEFGIARIDGGGFHTHRRIPVAVPENLQGLDPVSIDEGIENVRAFVRENREPTPAGDETIALEDLVTDLVDAGASAVTVSHDQWLYGEQLELVGYLPASNGYDICGPYDTVTIDGDEYPLRYRFTLDGLDAHHYEPVYVADSWVGTDPVSVEEGLDNVRELLAADSVDDLRPNR